jgi:hypothetical protein
VPFCARSDSVARPRLRGGSPVPKPEDETTLLVYAEEVAPPYEVINEKKAPELWLHESCLATNLASLNMRVPEEYLFIQSYAPSCISILFS